MKFITSAIVIVFSASLGLAATVDSQTIQAKNPGCVESAGIPCTSEDV